MLVTLIPLFDENMKVSAYSLFSQKQNFLLYPNLLGSGSNDGSSRIEGLEVIDSIGTETLLPVRDIFVSLNNISIFSETAAQKSVPHEHIVLLIDNGIPPVDMYINRIRELKQLGYRFAIRKLSVSAYRDYHEILNLMDYILINCEKIDVTKAHLYFSKAYPKIKLCAVNVKNMDMFHALTAHHICALYEGNFFRLPVTNGNRTVTPLKTNYIELMNLVNQPDFDLTKAADIIGRDTALVISLLRMVNRMALNSEITSIRHAAAMLGQKELKRWINTAAMHELCSDKPSELTRVSLLRARFAENIAPAFELGGKSSELFLMGLFSVLDIILDKPMEEALSMLQISKEIRDALLKNQGPFAELLHFIYTYENADWQEVSRIMVLQNITMETVYNAYMDTLTWYRKLFAGKL